MMDYKLIKIHHRLNSTFMIQFLFKIKALIH